MCAAMGCAIRGGGWSRWDGNENGIECLVLVLFGFGIAAFCLGVGCEKGVCFDRPCQSVGGWQLLPLPATCGPSLVDVSMDRCWEHFWAWAWDDMELVHPEVGRWGESGDFGQSSGGGVSLRLVSMEVGTGGCCLTW